MPPHKSVIYQRTVERVMLSECARIANTGGLDPKQFLDMARSISTGAAVMTWDRVFDVKDGKLLPPHAEPLPPFAHVIDKPGLFAVLGGSLFLFSMRLGLGVIDMPQRPRYVDQQRLENP